MENLPILQQQIFVLQYWMILLANSQVTITGVTVVQKNFIIMLMSSEKIPLFSDPIILHFDAIDQL